MFQMMNQVLNVFYESHSDSASISTRVTSTSQCPKMKQHREDLDDDAPNMRDDDDNNK